VQRHVSYTLGAGIWAALGVTVALPVNRHLSVKLYGSTGVSTRTGSDFNAGGIFLQYRWGGGL